MNTIRQTIIESIKRNYTRTQEVLGPDGYYHNYANPFHIIDKEKTLSGEILLRTETGGDTILPLENLPAPVLIDILRNELSLQRRILMEQADSANLLRWFNDCQRYLAEESKAAKYSRVQYTILSIDEILREYAVEKHPVTLLYDSNPGTPYPILTLHDRHQGATIEEIRTIEHITVDEKTDKMLILKLQFTDSSTLKAYINTEDPAGPVMFSECPFAHFAEDDIINLEEWLVHLLLPAEENKCVRFLAFKKTFAETKPFMTYDRDYDAVALWLKADVTSETHFDINIFLDQGYFKAKVQLEGNKDETRSFMSMFRRNTSVHKDIAGAPNFEDEYPDLLEEVFAKCEQADFWPTRLHVNLEPVNNN